jgi:hypothetical protein
MGSTVGDFFLPDSNGFLKVIETENGSFCNIREINRVSA